MAGYGATENGTLRSLRFLAESITSLDAEQITVRGFGKSGACEGDSGGPLLVRGADGAPLVAGVMSLGSASCLDEDTYVRLDAIEGWVNATVEAAPPSSRECGAISPEGRCFYGNAVWCEGGQLKGDACAAPKRCGWAGDRNGFRCVLASGDPCSGVDSVGACVGDAALWCYGGTLYRQPCGPCGVCRVEGATGRPVCTVEPGD
ncbi:MAG: trypsin-like serine protease, partial [Myxococcales bacterium]|nr:trypsin-like serine protease [Myxococcales bacterium]